LNTDQRGEGDISRERWGKDPSEFRVSARLLQTQRYLALVNQVGIALPPGVTLITANASPQLVLPKVTNTLYRARIVLGQTLNSAPTDVSIEAGGLQILDENPDIVYMVPAQWGGITALAYGQPLKTDWVDLRAQDWPGGGQWDLSIGITFNNTAAVDKTVDIHGKIEVQQFVFDGYDLPQPGFTD
jgi:hypothetical protein